MSDMMNNQGKGQNEEELDLSQFPKDVVAMYNLMLKLTGLVRKEKKGLPYEPGLYDEAQYSHIIAEYQGGQTEFENLIILCRSCNLQMGIKTFKEFY